MIISLSWLQSFFDTPLPYGEKIAETLTMHAFETEYDKEHNLLNIDVLSNRSSDCLSHYGIAREIEVMLGIPMRDNLLSEEKKLMSQNDSVVKIDADPSLCDRYMVAHMRIKHAETPQWMKERLESVGQKCIHPIVDISNYVMFELGQPTHAFDTSRIQKKDGKICIGVHASKKGDSLTLLDGTTISPAIGTPLIVDMTSDTFLGLAGVKGGKQSEVTKDTQEIIFECAHFNRAAIYTSSCTTGISTDASYRFERDPSPLLVPYALHRTVELLKEIAGATLVSVVDTGRSTTLNKRVVPIHISQFSKKIGIPIARDSIANTFDRLGFEYRVVEDVGARVVEEARKYLGVPYIYGASISYDAPRVFDCSSFVNFCFLQSGIILPRISANIFRYGTLIQKEETRAGDCVVSSGTDVEKQWTDTRGKEAFPYLLESEPLRDPVGHIGILTHADTVIHAAGTGVNCVIEEVLEHSDHFKKGVRYIRLIPDLDDTTYYVVVQPVNRTDLQIPEDLVEEYVRIAGFDGLHKASVKIDSSLPVPIHKEIWYKLALVQRMKDIGFHETITHTLGEKGDITTIHPLASHKSHLRNTLVEGLRVALEKNLENSEICGDDGMRLFEIGSVFCKDGEKKMLGVAVGYRKTYTGDKKDTERFLDIVENVFKTRPTGDVKDDVWETDFTQLVAFAPDISPNTPYPFLETAYPPYQSISMYPSIMRDIAIFVPSSVLADEVSRYIDECEDDTLVSYRLFDSFKKEEKISYAFRLVFQSDDRTLSNEEVNITMKEITKQMNKNDTWEVR